MLATLDPWWRVSLYLLAGVGAGVANALAGGGTFITFPTLLGLGVPALQANLSTTVGVVPSYVGSLQLFRKEIAQHRALLRMLWPWCVVGAATGCTVLLEGSATTFRSVVPWLIGAGTVLFAASPLITKSLGHVDSAHQSRRWGLRIGLLLASIYGGYFGAGLGILLLAVLAIALPVNVYELQGLRNALALFINVTAAVIFIIHGHLLWSAVGMLLLGTFIGGWIGALVVQRLSSTIIRVLVITIGVFTTVKLAVH